MITNEILHRSLAKKLYTDIEVGHSIKVCEWSDIETMTSEIEAGNSVVYWYVGKTIDPEFTHPTVRIHLGIIRKISVNSTLEVAKAADYLANSFLPFTSFVLYNLSGSSLVAVGQAVVREARRYDYFIDKDRIVNLPLVLEIGYGNTL